MTSESHPLDSGAKHPGERLATYFENFFKTIVGISTFGASLTFSRIVEAPVPTFHDYGISSGSIQYLIATSWLCFILALAFTSFFASALSLWRPQAVKAFGIQNGSERRKVLWYATAVSTLLFALSVVAFITISLVVAAYVGPVGWVALAFTVIFAILGFGTITWQSPLEWPNWLIRFEREEQAAFEQHTGLHQGSRRTTNDANTADFPTMPRQRSRQQSSQLPQQSGFRPERKESGFNYGRSTIGDYAGRSWRQIRRDDGYDMNRYSRASTVISDAYEPGRYGQGGIVYDDGVREGLVISRYAG